MKKSRKKGTFTGLALKVRCPFVNNRNRLILRSGRKKKLYKKQKGGFFDDSWLKELIERWKKEEIG